MLRPNRAPSRRNETSMDTQYERDQRRLEARRAAMRERNAGILGRLQKDPRGTATQPIHGEMKGRDVLCWKLVRGTKRLEGGVARGAVRGRDLCHCFLVFAEERRLPLLL